MADPFQSQDGRITASVIHADILALRSEVQQGFHRVDSRLDGFDTRVRLLEIDGAKDDGRDVAVDAARVAAKVAAGAAGESRRWLIALTAGVVLSTFTTIASILR